jgi:hypothetical protein
VCIALKHIYEYRFILIIIILSQRESLSHVVLQQIDLTGIHMAYITLGVNATAEISRRLLLAAEHTLPLHVL